MKIAINGMGRIGRCVLRAIFEHAKGDMEIAFINSTMDPATFLHLLRYDSVHGAFAADMTLSADGIVIDGVSIKLTAARDPAKIVWSGIDIVMDCTGSCTAAGAAGIYLVNGARHVMISAPVRDPQVPMIVYGVNHKSLSKEDKIISVGSCTTNCLGPIVKVLHENFGIVKGFALTVHSYTNDQNLVDSNHNDLRRARAACMSMIPTTTGAAKSIGVVMPELAGRLDGAAIRVPTPNVSLIDLTATLNCHVTVDSINSAIHKASTQDTMRKVLSYCTEPLVSIDFAHTEYSSIFDSLETRVVNNDFIRVLSWYDNEWGFAMRMIDVANLWSNLK